MNDRALFEATVPVFRHYLRRIDALLSALPADPAPLLRRRLAPHAFTAAEHLETAAGFALRGVYPLLGREAPAVEPEALDRAGLSGFVHEIDARLAALAVSDFEGATARTVRHTAGQTELTQDATTFATLFALPNFFFHLGMAFAILRHAGLDIGKADFDGQHVYAEGFRFADDPRPT